MPVSEPTIGWRAPRLNVLANGQQIIGAIEAEITSNNYYAADRFSVVVALNADTSTGISFWSSESDILLDIQFCLDGGITFISLIQGMIDSVVLDPVSGLAHLHGRDLSRSLMETRTQETFANRTASEIATLLAGRHGLSPQISATVTPVGRYYQSEHDSLTLDQFSRTTTEWDLLVFLAQQEGFDVYVQGTTLYFQPVRQQFGELFILSPDDLSGLRLEWSLTLARNVEVIVKSWNSRQNTVVIQKVSVAGSIGASSSGRDSGEPQRYIFVRPNLTSDAALRFAQQKLSELTRHERIIEADMPGELVISPRSMIMLEGTGSDFDQAYYVDVIERRIGHGIGFVQHIYARNTSPRTESAASA